MIQESHAVTEKPHYVVKFHTYRILQRHRAVLPATARLWFLWPYGMIANRIQVPYGPTSHVKHQIH